MIVVYNKSTILDFGLYNGYELGIVYVFDPGYLEYCINKMDDFLILDFDELIKVGSVNTKKDLMEYRKIGEAEHIPHINIFATYDELIESIDLITQPKFPFRQETIRKNSERVKDYQEKVKQGYPPFIYRDSKDYYHKGKNFR